MTLLYQKMGRLRRKQKKNIIILYVAIAFNLEKEISKNQGLDEFYLLINNFI